MPGHPGSMQSAREMTASKKLRCSKAHTVSLAQGVQVLGEERGDIFISIATVMLGRVTARLRGGRCTWMSHVRRPACADKALMAAFWVTH